MLTSCEDLTTLRPASPVLSEFHLPPSRPYRAAECVADLSVTELAVAPDDTNGRVMELFAEWGDVQGVVVVADDGRPVGLINRNDFFARFARPYARELFLRRECSLFANPAPLVFEAGVSISEAGAVAAAAGERALADGCIVVRGGAFKGLCSGVTLVRALSDLQGEQHQQLLASIEYAAAIQNALLADSRLALRSGFPGRHQLVWRPRDVVGGDCFFSAALPHGVLVGLMDCTGHGVPGALLTSIAISEAGRLAAMASVRHSPAMMLGELSRRMKEALQQHERGVSSELQADDGMDAVFLWAGADDPHVCVASAKLPVFLIGANDTVATVKGDRKGVGYRDTPADFTWTEHKIPRAGLKRIVLATDGLSDQIGGERHRAFGWSGLRRSLEAAAGASLQEQVHALWAAFETHQGADTRRDDVTLLGLDFETGPFTACTSDRNHDN